MDLEESNNILSLLECLELQLSEIEMLSSMYPTQAEFSITVPTIVCDMNRFVSGKTDCTPNELDFTLNLDVQDVKSKLETHVTLPHKYPLSKPVVSARSIGLNRAQHKALNCAVSEHINTLSPGELVVIPLVNWLTENAKNYFTFQPESRESESSDSKDSAKDAFCRMWIYSHHIYNKFKRREIVDCAQEMKLSGFSLPGKPGFICVEGSKKDCSEFLHHVKQMSWKKISLVKEEWGDSNEDNFRKFQKFQEISFQVRRGPAKEYHMDMGQFCKYLEENNCAHVFQELFGLEGHCVK